MADPLVGRLTREEAAMNLIRDPRLRELTATAIAAYPAHIGPQSAHAPTDPAALDEWFEEIVATRRQVELVVEQLGGAGGPTGEAEGYEAQEITMPVEGTCGRDACY